MWIEERQQKLKRWRDYSFISSSISSFFWQPVVGFATLNCKTISIWFSHKSNEIKGAREIRVWESNLHCEMWIWIWASSFTIRRVSSEMIEIRVFVSLSYDVIKLGLTKPMSTQLSPLVSFSDFSIYYTLSFF